MDTKAPPQTPTIPVSMTNTILCVLFGVILPAFTLSFEIVTGFSADIYIDPIPSVLHAIVIGLTPVIIALNLIRCIRDQPIRKWDLHLNSICIGISSVYAALYLPISPFALVGILAYGLGFLPLSPLITLLVAYRMRKALWRRAHPDLPIGLLRFFIGFSIGIIFLFIASTPRLITDYGMAQYAKIGTTEENSAVRMLRTFGSEQVLLDACYGRSQPAFFWGRSRSFLDTESARQLYYRVTGESFNENRSEKKLTPFRGRSRDRDLGGEHVGQRVDELFLEESRLDGIIEPELGTGYVEWTMVFRNDHSWEQQEARMLISMPTGGVGSRVTLWVNGKPREAAFGSKAKVREAYQNVAVRQRRDPILLNWAGPNLLLAQCFPILPDGGKMKVRIGISFPLETSSSGALTYRYPAIVAENFNIPEPFHHSVWYEEKTQSGVHSHPASDMTSAELATTQARLLKSARLGPHFVSAHPTDQNELVTFTPKPPANEDVPDAHAIVINGSLAMRATPRKYCQVGIQPDSHPTTVLRKGWRGDI